MRNHFLVGLACLVLSGCGVSRKDSELGQHKTKSVSAQPQPASSEDFVFPNVVEPKLVSIEKLMQEIHENVMSIQSRAQGTLGLITYQSPKTGIVYQSSISEDAPINEHEQAKELRRLRREVALKEREPVFATDMYCDGECVSFLDYPASETQAYVSFGEIEFGLESVREGWETGRATFWIPDLILERIAARKNPATVYAIDSYGHRSRQLSFSVEDNGRSGLRLRLVTNDEMCDVHEVYSHAQSMNE